MEVPDHVRRLLWEYPGHYLDPEDPRSHRVYFVKVFTYGELEAWRWAFRTFGPAWVREHYRRRPQAIPTDSRRLLARLLDEPMVHSPLDRLTPFPDIPEAKRAKGAFSPPFSLPGLEPVHKDEIGGVSMKGRVPFEVKAPPLSEHFYLVGGAALALHLGHRETEDLDFFTSVEGFEDADWEGLGFKVLSRQRGTVELLWQGVPVSLLHYPYPLLEPTTAIRGFRVAGLSDLAAMKLVAIAQHGARKDFVDIAFLLERFSLEEMLGFYTEKYGQEANRIHVLKALAYFEDAEAEAEIATTPPLSWEEVKARIVAALKETVV